MSKKDFIALADAIREHNQFNMADQPFTDQQLYTLAAFCRKQNSNFMRDRWLDYIAGNCGKNGGKVSKAA